VAAPVGAAGVFWRPVAFDHLSARALLAMALLGGVVARHVVVSVPELVLFLLVGGFPGDPPGADQRTIRVSPVRALWEAAGGSLLIKLRLPEAMCQRRYAAVFQYLSDSHSAPRGTFTRPYDFGSASLVDIPTPSFLAGEPSWYQRGDRRRTAPPATFCVHVAIRPTRWASSCILAVGAVAVVALSELFERNQPVGR